MSEPRFLPFGDAGLSVEFGWTASVAVSERVLALDAALRADPPPGLVETVPTFRALAVHLDPPLTDAAAMEAAIRPRLVALDGATGGAGASPSPTRRRAPPTLRRCSASPAFRGTRRSGCMPERNCTST